MRILIIEDEIKTANYVSKGLRENGFVVDIASDGEDGLFLATHHHYDLLIVDVMLPKLDGFTIVRNLRRLNPDIRIIFLSAKGEIEDKIKGLESGADDYVVKPFSFSELLTRIRTLFRRGPAKQSSMLTVADLKIDVAKHKVTRAAQVIKLTPKEFALLVLLVQRQGEVLSRTFIAEQVWDINFDTDTNVIDVVVKRLRQKIDDPFEKKLIHTVRGRGYSLDV